MNAIEIVFILCHTFGILRLSIAVVLSSSSNPASGKVTSGQSWTFECSVLKASGVIWYKRVGDLVTKIGYDSYVDDKEFSSGGRFILNQEEVNLNATKYSLILTGARSEDSGVYSCTSSKEKMVSTFIVCDDITETYCDCMVKKGWANPKCFSTFREVLSGIEDEYRSTLIGLLIALGIVSLYVIVIVVLYGRDLFDILRRRRKEKQTKKKTSSLPNRNTEAGKIFDKYGSHGNTDKTTLDPKGSPVPEWQSESSGYCGSQASSADRTDVKRRKETNTISGVENGSSNAAFNFDAEVHNWAESSRSESRPKWTPARSTDAKVLRTLSGNMQQNGGQERIHYDDDTTMV